MYYCRISIQAPRDFKVNYGMIIIYLQSMDINNFKYTKYNMHIYSSTEFSNRFYFSILS